jgi:hypothetical protein
VCDVWHLLTITDLGGRPRLSCNTAHAVLKTLRGVGETSATANTKSLLPIKIALIGGVLNESIHLGHVILDHLALFI